MKNLNKGTKLSKEQKQLVAEFEILLEADHIRLIRQSKRKDYYISVSGALYSVDNNNGITKVKPFLQSLGYLQYIINNKKEYAHRLVAEAFIEEFESHLQVNHKIASQKTNNHINNIEVCSAKDNLLHMHVTKQLELKDTSVSITDLKKIQQEINSNNIADLVKAITENTYSNIDSITIKFKDQKNT